MMGSTPSCMARTAEAMLDIRTMAVWLSVMLAASTTPLSSRALRRMTSGSALWGGPISAVTTKWPARRSFSRLLPDL